MSNRFGIPDSLLDAVKAVEDKAVSKHAAFGHTVNESELVTTRRADVGVEKVRTPDGKMIFKKKPRKEIAVEEVELEERKLDEISPKLARKAAASSQAKSFEYGSSAYGPDADKESDRLEKKADKARAHVQKRQGDAGVKKVDRMTGKLVYGTNRMEEVEQVDEAVGPYHKAAAHLEKMVKDPKFKRAYKEDIPDIESHINHFKSSDSSRHMQSAKAARGHDTIIRDIISDAVHKNSSKEDSKKWHDAAGLRRLKEAMDPVNKKELKGKYADRKDKDIDNDGDADKTDQYLHRRRKAISKAMGEKKDKVELNPKDDDRSMSEGIKSGLENPHNCATHVYSEQWGEGAPVKTMHADPDENGHIAWYDVMFEHGIEKRVPIEELSVLQSEMHNHEKNKKRRRT